MLPTWREGGSGWRRVFRTQALVEVAVVELHRNALGAQGERVRHERKTLTTPSAELIEGAMVGARAEDVHLSIEGLEARLLGDEAHRARPSTPRHRECPWGPRSTSMRRNVDDVAGRASRAPGVSSM